MFCRVFELLHLPVGTADGNFANLDRWKANANRDRLPILAANPDALVELQVVADCRDLSQYGWTVADQSRSLDGRRNLAIFDEVRFACRKNKFPARNIDLP